VKQLILGTAGHIDHGKTALVKALTGIDTDRLKEEKARGITIELGFAGLDLPGGQHLGIVDVPGHEKFVKNMVAGATGIDIVAMVIAADEGVMPQTREHLEICTLLGVRHGVVVLTKTDLVDEEWLELAREDVMDFVQGTDMKKMLKDHPGPLRLETACRIAAQTLDAFHYAHQQSVLHRDIKPENITLDENGAVRIMDFGITKLSSAETQHTSATMISPAYTALERFDIKKPVTHHSDIYSLGIFFYEMFTGRHPYKASTPVEMITAHLRAVPEPPREIANIPEEISLAILKALEKKRKTVLRIFRHLRPPCWVKPPGNRSTPRRAPLRFPAIITDTARRCWKCI